MMDLTIREIAEACGGKLVLRGETNIDSCVSSVVINSRLVEPQGVFIATVGERVDGHSFVLAAFAQGAILAVVQKMPNGREGEEIPRWGTPGNQEETEQAASEEIGRAHV